MDISPKLVRLKMKLLTFLAITLLAVNVFVVADDEEEGKIIFTERFNFATNMKKVNEFRVFQIRNKIHSIPHESRLNCSPALPQAF